MSQDDRRDAPTEHGSDRRGGQQLRQGRNNEQQDHSRSAVEWVTFAISAAILLALIGLVIVQQGVRGDLPAVIEVQPQLQAVQRVGESYYLPVAVTNQGDKTAGDVRVEVSLVDGQGGRESSQFQIDFLAGGATRLGTAVFRGDPSHGNVRADVVSFVHP